MRVSFHERLLLFCTQPTKTKELKTEFKISAIIKIVLQIFLQQKLTISNSLVTLENRGGK
jgi:hypothetical protein